jgi:phosphohistidine phosphatase
MILLLMRHGNAAKPQGESHLRLTGRGKKEAALAAQALQARQIKLETIWHSPKPRAVETAGIVLAKAGNTQTRLEEKKELAPEGDVQKIYEDLMLEKPDCVALISHLPFLEKLVYRIQQETGHSSPLEFPTAGIQAFQWDGKWEWLWEANSH